MSEKGSLKMNNKIELENVHLHGFKINTQGFLAEWWGSGTESNQRLALQKPFEFFVRYLESLTNRCAELKDPVLDKIMSDMALYNNCDPYSEDFNKDFIEEINKNYDEFIGE